MKIAICFSGHLRNFYVKQLDQLFHNIQSLQSKGNEVHCFFSIWNKYNNKNSELDIQEISIDQLKLLDPIDVEIENYENIKHNFYLKDIHPTIEPESPAIISSGILHSTPMFYKIYRCNLLKSKYETVHNFKYDVVVRYRSNINLLDLMNFEHVNNNIFYNLGHGNPDHRSLGYTHESLMTQDMFFYGDSNIMDIVCNLYNNLNTVMSKHGSTGPERMLYDWCFLENNLKHEISPINFEYDHT